MARIPLYKAVDLAVRGVFPDDGVEVNGHDFYIRSLKNKNKLKGDETGYFRHQHVGKDDRVFFSIKVKGKDDYDAKITRIQYRGPLNSGTANEDIVVTGLIASAGGVGAASATILTCLKKLNLQSKIDGDWEPAAAKIVDAIGIRMAADID